MTTPAGSLQRRRKISAGTSATSVATNAGQTCPPIGVRSCSTSEAKIPAAIPIAGKIAASPTSVTVTRCRSRQSVGASAAVTIRYAPARMNSGTALK